MAHDGCSLCATEGGNVIWRGEHWRVVRAEEAGFPAFYRLVWNAHVVELSDLPVAQRHQCMDAVCAIEQALRHNLNPTKINLASLGNMVAHLHWHVIARFEEDSHFPGPVWTLAQRETPPSLVAAVAVRRGALEAAICRAMDALAV